jgi:hypothetical protein
MGNSTSIDSCPVELSKIFSLVEQPNNGCFPTATKSSFKHNIKLYSFSYDDVKEDVQIEPVLFEDSAQFSKKKCYLVLYLERIAAESPKTPEASLKLNLAGKITRKKESLMRLSISTTELLTPRGLEYSFASSGSKTSSNMQFAIYVWNGKESDAAAQSCAIAQAFNLENVLTTKPQVLEYLFEAGSPLPLSSFVTDDISPQSKKNLLNKLHLLAHFIPEGNRKKKKLIFFFRG